MNLVTLGGEALFMNAEMVYAVAKCPKLGKF